MYNGDAAEGSSAVASALNLGHLERQQSANQLGSIIKSMTTSVFQWNKNNSSEELTVVIITPNTN